VNELPIEAVVVTHEQRATFGVFLYPARKALHHALRIIEAESILACESTDRESVWNPFLGDWLQPAIEGMLQPFPHQHGTKANHAIVAWDGAISLHVHHDICHRGHSKFALTSRTIVGTCAVLVLQPTCSEKSR